MLAITENCCNQTFHMVIVIPIIIIQEYDHVSAGCGYASIRRCATIKMPTFRNDMYRKNTTTTVMSEGLRTQYINEYHFNSRVGLTSYRGQGVL